MTAAIDEMLNRYKVVLGNDLEKYRNHVCRVFAGCVQLDDAIPNKEKYAIAAVFHDIGIWTAGTIDYIAPSVKEAKQYLEETGKAKWTEEITGMIVWHHKISRYRGSFETTIENFRRADWTDVSLGWLHFGIDRRVVRGNNKQWPTKGFHRFLLKRIIKNFFRHPLHPLPMFRR